MVGRRAARRLSTVSRTSATQTSPNPIQRDGGMASWVTQTPIENWMQGVRYWIRPIMLNGMRPDAAANSNSGTAVIAPARVRATVSPGP